MRINVLYEKLSAHSSTRAHRRNFLNYGREHDSSALEFADKFPVEALRARIGNFSKSRAVNPKLYADIALLHSHKTWDNAYIQRCAIIVLISVDNTASLCHRDHGLHATGIYFRERY